MKLSHWAIFVSVRTPHGHQPHTISNIFLCSSVLAANVGFVVKYTVALNITRGYETKHCACVSPRDCVYVLSFIGEVKLAELVVLDCNPPLPHGWCHNVPRRFFSWRFFVRRC